jgi:hypothetical protein
MAATARRPARYLDTMQCTHTTMELPALLVANGLEKVQWRDRPAAGGRRHDCRSGCIDHVGTEGTYRAFDLSASEGVGEMFRENWTMKALPLLEQVQAGDQGALMHACDEDNDLRNTLIELIDEGYIDGAGVLRAPGTSEPTIVFGALQLRLKGRIALRR